MKMKQKALSRLGKQPGGFVMFMTLTFAVLLGLASVLAITPSVGEALKAGQELRDKRLFFLADGGATLCRGELKNRLNSALPDKLAALVTLTTFVTTYVTGNDPAQFLLDYAYEVGNPALLGGVWTKDSTTQAHLPLSSGKYQCTLTVTSRVAPVSSVGSTGETAVFRYLYTILGTGTEGSVTRTVSLQGTFSVLVQQDNFARYALFTNTQGGVYFAQGATYYGPVHTNGQFNFMQNPGAHFYSTIESVSATATYGNSPGSPIQLAANHNGTIDVPTFDQGLTLGAANIAMPGTTTATAEQAIALTGYSGSTSSTGVYLGASGGAMKGGIYVNSDATISLSVPSSGVAQYTIVQGSTTTTVQVTAGSNQTTVKVGSGSPTTYTGVPNGMLFVNGSITSLAGTLEQNTQLTLAATADVRITNNLVYQNYTPASGSNPPNANGINSVMGIISWNNNIHFNDPSTSGITVTATLMAPSTASGLGEVINDNYNNGTPSGTATILGSVIQNQYGAFGLSSGGSITSGYARNFVYDTRMSQGMFPPYFPTTGAAKSTLTGVTDRPNWAQTN
ncbi:MAG: DUF4900 domain-containing protein [Candidatus Methylomirabilales bacterium]